MTKFRNAPPRAGALVESLRGLGYSPATALADIIDNSVAAGSSTVDLVFKWDASQSYIAIVDDGLGMDADQLDSAMRLGDRNPLDARGEHDLGRFGLGLKTASFSQARSLTVASRAQGGAVETLRWDLDVLSNPESDGWHLLEGPHPGSEDRIAGLVPSKSGTVVLWEKLDRIVTPGFESGDFLDLVDVIERHLGMTFHRYLEGSSPALRILINGRAVKPWDPFMEGHPAKAWAPPEVRIGLERDVAVQCHVLPHKDKLSPRELEHGAGPAGWTSGQGFYVYRNRRLLLAGSWLGLGAGRGWIKDEAHRLARIRLDIPNTADADWKLDIRKSTARPPVYLRTRLARLAEDTRNRARRVFAHRGQPASRSNGQQIELAWEATQSKAGMRYQISRSHGAVQQVLEKAGGFASDIEAMLRVIEETVPVQRIWLDTAEQKETPLTAFNGEPDAEVVKVLEAMFSSLVRRSGMSPAEARHRLSRMEPFDRFPALVAGLSDNITNSEL